MNRANRINRSFAGNKKRAGSLQSHAHIQSGKQTARPYRGAETTNERTELLPDAQGKPVITKRVVTKTKDAPNVTAIIFALSNLKSEQWKNRQTAEVKADIKQQKQLSVQEAREFINQIEKEI